MRRWRWHRMPRDRPAVRARPGQTTPVGLLGLARASPTLGEYGVVRARILHLARCGLSQRSAPNLSGASPTRLGRDRPTRVGGGPFDARSTHPLLPGRARIRPTPTPDVGTRPRAGDSDAMTRSRVLGEARGHVRNLDSVRAQERQQHGLALAPALPEAVLARPTGVRRAHAHSRFRQILIEGADEWRSAALEGA